MPDEYTEPEEAVRLRWDVENDERSDFARLTGRTIASVERQQTLGGDDDRATDDAIVLVLDDGSRVRFEGEGYDGLWQRVFVDFE